MNRGIRALCTVAVLLGFAVPLFADPPEIIILAKPQVFGDSEPTRRSASRTGTTSAPRAWTASPVTTLFKDGKNILDPATLTAGNPSIQCATLSREAGGSLQTGVS